MRTGGWERSRPPLLFVATAGVAFGGGQQSTNRLIGFKMAFAWAGPGLLLDLASAFTTAKVEEPFCNPPTQPSRRKKLSAPAISERGGGERLPAHLLVRREPLPGGRAEKVRGGLAGVRAVVDPASRSTWTARACRRLGRREAGGDQCRREGRLGGKLDGSNPPLGDHGERLKICLGRRGGGRSAAWPAGKGRDGDPSPRMGPGQPFPGSQGVGGTRRRRDSAPASRRGEDDRTFRQPSHPGVDLFAAAHPAADLRLVHANRFGISFATAQKRVRAWDQAGLAEPILRALREVLGSTPRGRQIEWETAPATIRSSFRLESSGPPR